jgi:hypothetical protein
MNDVGFLGMTTNELAFGLDCRYWREFLQVLKVFVVVDWEQLRSKTAVVLLVFPPNFLLLASAASESSTMAD